MQVERRAALHHATLLILLLSMMFITVDSSTVFCVMMILVIVVVYPLISLVLRLIMGVIRTAVPEIMTVMVGVRYPDVTAIVAPDHT
jgi:hypothetical protein